VTEKEKEALEADFSKEEIRGAIFDSYAHGAPCLDGFSFMFYQKIWAVIKTDLLALFKTFEQGRGNITRLNYAMIILTPKE
jgi:hypothetical protein